MNRDIACEQIDGHNETTVTFRASFIHKQMVTCRETLAVIATSPHCYSTTFYTKGQRALSVKFYRLQNVFSVRIQGASGHTGTSAQKYRHL